MGMASIYPCQPEEPIPEMTFDEFITDPTGGCGKTTITKRYAGKVVGFDEDEDGFACAICTFTTDAMHPLPDIDSLNNIQLIPKEWFNMDGTELQIGDLVAWFSGRTDEHSITSNARTTFTEYRYYRNASI